MLILVEALALQPQAALDQNCLLCGKAVATPRADQAWFGACVLRLCTLPPSARSVAHLAHGKRNRGDDWGHRPDSQHSGDCQRRYRDEACAGTCVRVSGVSVAKSCAWSGSRIGEHLISDIHLGREILKWIEKWIGVQEILSGDLRTSIYARGSISRRSCKMTTMAQQKVTSRESESRRGGCDRPRD